MAINNIKVKFVFKTKYFYVQINIIDDKDELEELFFL